MTIHSAAFRQPIARAVLAAFACLLALAVWIRLGPIDPALLDLDDATSTIVTDRNGVPLYEALSGDGARSTRFDPNQLPEALVAATVAAEDRRFWSHPGVDMVAVARATVHNLTAGRVVEGGSTITQQVAKLLLDRRHRAEAGADARRRRGFGAKLREAVLALRLEQRLTKREILAHYLNLAAYGNQLTGAAHASRAYFGRDAALLTSAQAAFLAGLPQRPSVFNPYRRPESAIARQRVVLQRMAVAGVLTEEEAARAADERLEFVRDPAPFLAPHFVEMVLASITGPRPARLRTTLDAGLQSDIAGIIRSHRAILDRHGAANVAVVVLDNVRGAWLAWEGSGNYFDQEHGGAIDGARTPRQPGSALKPFTYALAFEEGFTPASVLPDVPSHFPTAEPGVLYSPRNYDGRYRGPLLARRALAGSENIPAVALASHLGVPRLLRFLNRAGFSTLQQTASYYGLGITLGNAEVRLDELVAAYAAFARGGRWIRPTWRAEEEQDAREERTLVSPLTAYWITDVLADPYAREYVFGRGGWLEFPFPVAAKTGTSQAYHDNWTIGYTRAVTVGVWVGNFDRKPLRDSTGVTGAGPIFHAVMQAAVRRVRPGTYRGRIGDAPGSDTDPIVARPDGLDERHICALSGMPAQPWCPLKQREWLPAGGDEPCPWHRQYGEDVVVDWPPEYRQWAREAGLFDERRPVSGFAQATAGRSSSTAGNAAAPAAAAASISIANPPDGATYLIDPTLRREFQTLSLKARTPRPVEVSWAVDGKPIGTASSESSLDWPLEPGVHRITARDARGRTAEATITVR
ncbi:MAG TPA: penicillin-binding protein 1C [Vicinamibacterales bacterium]|nr:penicillin-binding protein 1C [Vicinamibacterales bacterium]